MSFSITIYAFNRQKSSQAMANFLSFIKNKRNNILEVEPEPTADEISKLREQRAKEFFDDLKKHDLFIPWVAYEKESGTNEFGQGHKIWTVEDKLIYIFSLGALFHYNDKEKMQAYLISDFDDLFEKYNYLEDNWSKQNYYDAKRNNEYASKYFSYFTELKKSYNSELEQFIDDLKYLYLNLSSISLCVHSSLGDDQHLLELKAISDYYSLELLEEQIPSKESIVKIYSSLDKDRIKDISKKYAKENKCSLEDANILILKTLKKLKPLAKEFKEDKNTELIISNDSNWPDVYPKDANKYLDKTIKELQEDILNDKEIIKILR